MLNLGFLPANRIAAGASWAGAKSRYDVDVHLLFLFHDFPHRSTRTDLGFHPGDNAHRTILESCTPNRCQKQFRRYQG